MKSNLQTQLSAMFALAHEHTDHSRIELAGMLADVFLESAELSLREEELVNELIEQLIMNQSATLRGQIVEKFSDVSRLPRKLAMSLASGHIDVARDILKSSTTLRDKDLITIIEAQGSEHAQAIAQRIRIAAAVADALVTTGDIQVMRLVAENLGAELSPMALDVLTEAACYADPLRLPMIHRPDLSAEGALRLFWWLSQDLRRVALKRYGISEGQIDEALSKTIEEFLARHELDKQSDEVMLQVAEWLNERGAVSVTILPQVLRLGHFRLFNILLSRLSNMTLSLIDTIVSETGGRGLAVVCRAIGIDKPGFVSMFLLSRGARHDEQIVHPRELSHALAAFDRISVAMAQDMLHSWKVNPEYLTQHAAVGSH